MWSDLKQDEKFELIKDYVRRGFHNLDDIMNDYDSQMSDNDLKKLNPPILKDNQPIQDVINELFNEEEYYSIPEYPGAKRQDLDIW